MKHDIHKKCPCCGKITALTMTNEQLASYNTYLTGNQLIQDIFPEFNPFKREFLITGYCISCQSKIFSRKLPEDLREWKL